MRPKQILIGLLFILILILAIMTGLKLLKDKQIIYKKAAPATQLSLSTGKDAYRIGEDFVTIVNIDTGENAVNGVELFINYDSSKLIVTNIEPGDFLTDADVIDPTIANGAIHYTLLQPPGHTGVSGTGTLAQITFQPIQSGSTNISFDTQQTLAVGLGEGGQNILAQALPIQISAYSPETILSLSSDIADFTVGDEFNLNILAQTGNNKISGVELKLIYDATRLEFLEINPGNFLESPDVVGPQLENSSFYYALLQSPSEEGATGQGRIATARFRILKPGQIEIRFSQDETIAVGLGGAGQNLLLEANSFQLDAAPSATGSPLPAVLQGDINKDKVVNLLDYIIFMENFAKNPEDYPGVDINEDNKVNLLDYIILFENFGEQL